MFLGDTYIANSPTNETIQLQPTTVVNSIVLSGGGSSVFFDRLTGKTSQVGTVTIASIGSPAEPKQITISSNGVAQ